jgi:uncharacterized cupredoxin-like copper-binding protein
MPDRKRASASCQIVAAALVITTAGRAQAATRLGLPSEAAPVEIRIVSTEFKFMPAKIRVASGRAVTLILDNSGAETEHGIFVPAFRFHLQAEAGKVVQRTIVFDKPGEFDFLCDLPGHGEAGMKGTLTVGAPSAAR